MKNNIASNITTIKGIKERQTKLRSIARELKSHFVGLDNIIDRIIKSLETWYCCPELMTRPLIICLWGATGVGKTDLVRRLVKLLGFQDRFSEVEMMNKGNSTYHWQSSITSVLAQNPKIESGKPFVLLLDEIQNFRTLNEEGHEIPEYKFRDIWTLLSDGKLPFRVEYEALVQFLWDLTEKEKKEAEDKKQKKEKQKQDPSPKIPPKTMHRHVGGDDPDDEYDEYDDDCPVPETCEGNIVETVEEAVDIEDDYDSNYYNLRHFKAVLRLSEPLEEIATWSISKKKAMVISKLSDKTIYEETDYTKSLIFISGNLDEAYEFSTKTSEVDVDADIFHELSLKINILNIKSALQARFKPEQIARFGNMHVIYPTLSKKSYEVIIQRRINDIVDNIHQRTNIKIEVDKTINDLIYENGVFPTQGTRPVFSTISEIIESPLPPFLLKSLTKNKTLITLFYTKPNICAKIGGDVYKFNYRGVLDKLKDDRNKNMDRRVLNAVHEAGHSVIYGLLFKFAPPQISALTASQDIGGFIWVHDICGSKKLIHDKICTVLSGGIAEKIIFGEENLTWGLQDDLHEATKLAGAMVKRYGMSEFNSFIMDPHRSDIVNTDLASANAIIEKIIQEEINRASQMLSANLSLFYDVVDFLLNNKNMKPEDFKKICSNHGVSIKIKKSEEIIYTDFYNKYLKHKSRK